MNLQLRLGQLLACGSMWKYLKDFGIYRCPVAQNKEYLSYTGVESIGGSGTGPSVSGCYPAGWQGAGCPLPIKYRNQIKNGASRIVFMCEGSMSAGAWDGVVNNDVDKWYSDEPPIRHGYGTTFAFADGHTAYRKYTDKRTAQVSWGGARGPQTLQNDTVNAKCNVDYYWFRKSIWGNCWPQGYAKSTCSQGNGYDDVFP